MRDITGHDKFPWQHDCVYIFPTLFSHFRSLKQNVRWLYIMQFYQMHGAHHGAMSPDDILNTWYIDDITMTLGNDRKQLEEVPWKKWWVHNVSIPDRKCTICISLYNDGKLHTQDLKEWVETWGLSGSYCIHCLAIYKSNFCKMVLHPSYCLEMDWPNQELQRVIINCSSVLAWEIRLLLNIVQTSVVECFTGSVPYVLR